ncbi:MAG: fgrK [Verrucomicrobiales bacterium]|nr:fgrK [Verrucomicrobiales bacterium]
MKDIRSPAEVADLVRNLGLPSPGFTRAGVWRHSKKDGQWVDDDVAWVSLVVDGEPCRLVVVMDVTERRWAEELLKDINAETERRLEARTMELQAAATETEAFVRAVVQDPQSPLRRIQQHSDDLARELQDSGPKSKELNQKIAETVGKIDQFASNFLHLSNLTYRSLNLQPVNLSRMVASVLQRLREQDPERQVQIEIASNIQVFADSELTEILLTNLLHTPGNLRGPTRTVALNSMRSRSRAKWFVSFGITGLVLKMESLSGCLSPFLVFIPNLRAWALALA